MCKTEKCVHGDSKLLFQYVHYLVPLLLMHGMR